jgi:trehalose 2-sulfotransferase
MAKKIVVCATQRCGSTMLLEDMRSAKVLGLPEEWFAPWSTAPAETDYAEALQKVLRNGTGENGVFAIKLMANQLFPVDARLRSVFEQQEGFAPNVHKLFNDAVWVRILRRDALAQAMSRVIAQQTKVYHATQNKSDTHFAGGVVRGYDASYAENTKYDFDLLLKQFLKVQLENAAWDNFFQAYEIEPLTLIYEEIAAQDPNEVVAAIAAHAGIEAPTGAYSRKLAKLAGETSAQWREMFYKDLYARKFEV